MSTVDKEKITTAEQLLQLPGDFGPCELVRGELIMMSPGGYLHGHVFDNLYPPLSAFVRKNRLGRTCACETGFILEPDERTVRAPDIAFVRVDRLVKGGYKKFFPGPPDLAVEIRSLNDRPAAISAKITMYLEVGVHVVWDIDPESETVAAYRPDSSVEVLRVSDTLTEEDLLPGFAIEVKDIFAWD